MPKFPGQATDLSHATFSNNNNKEELKVYHIPNKLTKPFVQAPFADFRDVRSSIKLIPAQNFQHFTGSTNSYYWYWTQHQTHNRPVLLQPASGQGQVDILRRQEQESAK